MRRNWSFLAAFLAALILPTATTAQARDTVRIEVAGVGIVEVVIDVSLLVDTTATPPDTVPTDTIPDDPPVDPADISGEYLISVTGLSVSPTLTIGQDGAAVTGTLSGYGSPIPLSGTYDGENLLLQYAGMGIEIVATGNGNGFVGAVTLPQGTYPIAINPYTEPDPDPDPPDPDPDPDPDPPPEGILWSDGFESGTMGANWIGGDREGNRPVTTRARTGDYSLMFRFRGSPDQDADATSERRFCMPQSLGEVWVEYWLWIPENYAHRQPPGTPSNNKFFILWDSDSYPGGGAGRLSVGLHTWADGAGNSRGNAAWSNSLMGWIMAVAIPWSGGIGEADKGRWNRVRFHMKVGTRATDRVLHTGDYGDGLFEMWWNNQQYVSHAMSLYDPDDNAFRCGYVLGWANSGFDENTYLYVDDWRIFASDPGW